jgi:hypothetical protein
LPEWTVRQRVRQVYRHAITREDLPEEIERAECRFALAIEQMEGVKKVSVCMEVA